MINHKTDRFLSEEDLDLQTMSWKELLAWWNLWLTQAQISNDVDRDEYSHGVFRHEPVTDARWRNTEDERPAAKGVSC